MISRKRGALWLRAVFLVFLVLAVTLIVRDGMRNWTVAGNAEWRLLLPAIAFSMMDVVIDFLVWLFFLARVHGGIALSSAFTIFLSGYATDLAPAKLGAFSRPFFLKIVEGVPLRLGISVQVNALFVDFCAAVFIAILGLLALRLWTTAAIIAVISLLILALFILILRRGQLQSFLQRTIRRFVPAEMALGVAELQEAINALLRPRYSFPLMAAKMLSWLAMGMVLFFVSRIFGYPLTWIESLFVVTVSSLFGTFSLIPNGLGVTEASLVGFQVYLNIPLEAAVMVAFTFRGVASWSWILIGNVTGYFMCRSRNLA